MCTQDDICLGCGCERSHCECDGDPPETSYEVYCIACGQTSFLEKLERGQCLLCPICDSLGAFLVDPQVAQEWERFNEV
jgi:hypothetical protein